MPQQVLDRLTDKQAMDFIETIEKPFRDVPHIPKKITEILVKISPWLAMVGGVFGILGALQSIGYGLGGGSAYQRIFSEFAGMPSWYFVVVGFLQLLSSFLLLLSVKHLKNRELTGWVYMFWNMAIMVVQSIVGLLAGIGGVVGFVVVTALSYYLLFEMKQFFGKKAADNNSKEKN
ncbi:MAG: hypothetical protein WAU07_00250 [Microgenomates group bacterium]